MWNENKIIIMKTKHFLITTEDGSVVAVVNCDCASELIRKSYKCVREQLDDNCIGSILNIKWDDIIISDGYTCVLKSIYNGIINASRIEIY